MLWSDGTHVDKAGRNKVQVVTASWGNHPVEYQRKAPGLTHIAVLPQLQPHRGETPESPSFKERKHLVLQQGLAMVYGDLQERSHRIHHRHSLLEKSLAPDRCMTCMTESLATELQGSKTKAEALLMTYDLVRSPSAFMGWNHVTSLPVRPWRLCIRTSWE
ncbi:hypothetical protein WJX79_004962 [Trebouxia sp. C0005]